MLTHVHKVIHLVVGTFEQGLETSPTECPTVPSALFTDLTVPPVLFTEKTEVTVSDRTLVSVGLMCLVSGSVKTLASVFNWMLGDLVTEHWRAVSGPADGAVHRGDTE